MLSFTERMELGRKLAQVARNRGQHTGKSQWTVRSTGDHCRGIEPGSWEALCLVARQSWRSECEQIRVDFASACLNRLDDQSEKWEIEL